MMHEHVVESLEAIHRLNLFMLGYSWFPFDSTDQSIYSTLEDIQDAIWYIS
jgi:hypothetical protein